MAEPGSSVATGPYPEATHRERELSSGALQITILVGMVLMHAKVSCRVRP